MTPGVTLTYRQRDVSIEIDGAPAGTRRLFTAMIGNTENGGGGMKLLPGARFDDGVLDLIDVGEVSRLEVLRGILPKLYSGAHVHHPKVRMARGTSFRFDSGDVETLVDLDGEMVGRLPLEVTILPQAFRVGTV
jgi:diacylglycerol kinase family enzyme